MNSKVTCIAPINIAVIKYWGKKDESLNLPLNSSISITLDVNDLCTKTTLLLSEAVVEDTVFLNGTQQNIDKNARIKRCLAEARSINKSIVKAKCHIISNNNFPTAAGLASSASGYACLAKCLGEVYGLDADLTTLARLGSGSACRSIHGGFVKWIEGTNHTDSIAVQLAPEDHWDELKCLILVVSNKQKSVPSTEAMRRSVHTSDFLKYRIDCVLKERILAMEEAIMKRDFESFAKITMKDSNQLHAICQETYPPISPPYMNDTSHQIVNIIHRYNQDKVKAAYTFDAGSNAVLFTLKENLEELIGTIMYHFPQVDKNGDFINVPSEQAKIFLQKGYKFSDISTFPGALQRIIVTKPGPGATVIEKN